MRLRDRHTRPRRPSPTRILRPTCDSLETRIVPTGLSLPANYVIHHTPIVLSSGSGGNLTSNYQPFGGGSPSPTGFSPTQIRTAYGINQISLGSIVGDGTGQTIAIVDSYDTPAFVNSTAANFSSSDLAQFDKTFGLPDPPSFTKYNQNGATTGLPGTDPVGPGNINWETEEALDIEWAHALAPMASIDLVEANSPSNDLFTAVSTAAGLPGVSVVSMSWGGGEFSGEQSYDSTYFLTPSGHQGVTFLAATGDDGSPASYPSYSPNVVAVGGTTLYVNSDNTYQAEGGWSGSGGGTSTQEAAPSFQQGVQSTGMRTAPDVSFDGDPASGVSVYDSYFDTSGSGNWITVGGTSFSTPAWSALVAIANQGRVASGSTTLDGPSQTLPMLYQLSSNDYHDITTGNNGGYTAGTGYDEVTGIGSPKANLLVPDLAGSTQVSTLHVTSFTKTTTGATVTFNKPFKLAPLNLYDTASAGLGPADVTIVGASTGPVTGSLVVGSTNQSFTFVKTNGILAPDTYTVTFRSAANGFVDTSGNLLDGNADGTTGDNYVTTFTVAPSTARVISVPSFARGPGQAVNVPATGSNLPLTISDGTGVTSISETLSYNPSLLTITGAYLGSSLPSGASGTISSSNGRVTLNITSPTALPAGLDTFATLVASVPSTAPYGSKEDLVLSNIAVNGGAIAATNDDNVHVVAYLGDTTGNGGYSSLDVTLIRRVLTSTDTGFAAFPVLDPTILADIAGAGSLSSLDSTYLDRYLVGLSQPRIPALPNVTITSGGPDPLIWIPQTQTASTGSTLTVPVDFQQTNSTAISLNSADLALEFDPSVFTVTGLRLGNVPKGFTLTDSFDNATGEIIASIQSPSGSLRLTPGTVGSLLQVDLKVRPGAAPGASRINLLGEGRVGGSVLYTSLNHGGLTLIPAPSNADTDSTDGIVTVTQPTTPSHSPVASSPAGLANSPSTSTGTSSVLVPSTTSAARAAAIDQAIQASHGVTTPVVNGPNPAQSVPIAWSNAGPSTISTEMEESLTALAKKKAGAGRVALTLGGLAAQG